jgi:alpha-L-fucosidase
MRPLSFIVAALCMGVLQPVRAESDVRDSGREKRMERWRELRFGLFIHWGPYSHLGGEYNGETYPRNTEWIMRSAKIPRQDYRKVAEAFDPKRYDAGELVGFAQKSGFKYVVMTAKHYDGFALFDSKVSDFDAVDVLPSRRDLLGEFSAACKEAKMPLGYSYAVDRDWYHPGGNTLGKAWDPSQSGSREKYLENVALPQLKELQSGYGPVLCLLTDTAARGVPHSLSSAFRQAISPEVVMSAGFSGERGDYHYTDGRPIGHSIAAVDWEKCETLGDSWGFRKGATRWKSASHVIQELVSTASKGGNYLLNVGLDGDGRFPPEAQERLSAVGEWLGLHGESIYGTTRSPFVKHPWKGGATVRDEGEKGYVLYLHLFGKESRGKIGLESLLTRPTSAQVLGGKASLPVAGRAGRWEVDLTGVAFGEDVTVIKVRLPEKPSLGPGAIVAAGDGSYFLDPARGIFAKQRGSVGRSASSADLQVTAFADAKDSGEWEIYAETPSKIHLEIVPLPPAPVEGKTVIVRVNDKKVAEAVVSFSSPSEGRTLPLRSASFPIPAGASRITISGDDSGSTAPILTSSIKLQPSK